MPDDLDIYRSAKLLIDQHGEDAPIIAAMQADKCLEAGDLDGKAVWMGVIREWFESEEQEGAELSRFLIEQILDTGLEPVEPPPLLPPIAPEDIELLCWMGIEAEGSVS